MFQAGGGVMLVQRRRRWTNITPTPAHCLVEIQCRVASRAPSDFYLCLNRLGEQDPAISIFYFITVISTNTRRRADAFLSALLCLNYNKRYAHQINNIDYVFIEKYSGLEAQCMFSNTQIVSILLASFQNVEHTYVLKCMLSFIMITSHHWNCKLFLMYLLLIFNVTHMLHCRGTQKKCLSQK